MLKYVLPPLKYTHVSENRCIKRLNRLVKQGFHDSLTKSFSRNEQPALTACCIILRSFQQIIHKDGCVKIDRLRRRFFAGLCFHLFDSC